MPYTFPMIKRRVKSWYESKASFKSSSTSESVICLTSYIREYSIPLLYLSGLLLKGAFEAKLPSTPIENPELKRQNVQFLKELFDKLSRLFIA
jgi:hypothetical protein